MATRRILFVSPTAPDDRSYGGALRSHALLRALRTCGEVTTLVLTPGNTNMLEAHDDPTVPARITFHHSFFPWPHRGLKAVRTMIAAALKGREFDLVVVRYMFLGLYVRPCVDAPFVLDADDLSKRHDKESAPPLRRALAACRKLARDTVTRVQLSRYAHVWFVNDADMASFAVGSGSMLPNVTDVAAPRPRPDPGTPTVLFVGNLQYGPNVQAVEYFVRQCWPAVHRAAPASKLRIVGKRSSANGEQWNSVPGVHSPGFVDDLLSEYDNASVVIAPVFSGGGTQIKVLDALAHGAAVVVSDFVGAGFRPHLVENVHLAVARSDAAWAEQCLALMNDQERARSLGAAGREAVARHYSPQSFSRTVEATISRLLK